jgi:hypothetical protein
VYIKFKIIEKENFVCDKEKRDQRRKAKNLICVILKSIKKIKWFSYL